MLEELQRELDYCWHKCAFFGKIGMREDWGTWESMRWFYQAEKTQDIIDSVTKN